MTMIKITCGCNTVKKPVVFTSIKDAENHAITTGHILHGSVVITRS